MTIFKLTRKGRTLLQSLLRNSHGANRHGQNRSVMAVSSLSTENETGRDLNSQDYACHQGDYFVVVEDDQKTREYSILLSGDINSQVPASANIVTDVPKKQPMRFIPLYVSERDSQASSRHDMMLSPDSILSSVATGPVGEAVEAAAPEPQCERDFLYGLDGEMLYDFAAERPGELSVAANEAVLILALRNDDWFVVRRYGRHHQPGLVPVSWVGIKHNGQMGPTYDVRELAHMFNLPTVGGLTT